MDAYDIYLTSTRKPSKRTRTFLKVLGQLLPTSFKFNRGHLGVKMLYQDIGEQAPCILGIVRSRKGNPSAIHLLGFLKDDEANDYGVFKLEKVALPSDSDEGRKVSVPQFDTLYLRRSSMNPVPSISQPFLDFIKKVFSIQDPPDDDDFTSPVWVEIGAHHSSSGIHLRFVTRKGKKCLSFAILPPADKE
ncbi:MAG: hypothetical protein KAR35_00805 [Candidatus Heimdallarchaeota archaeon]|nr:hypothetical protein [Candidatus Heimdallarchaeota archaeon]MCK5047892.1 hypothetical protein [Candidatus Heimdallarchaeota archaeon]